MHVPHASHAPHAHRLEEGAEHLRLLKNAGVYGGWAGDDPDEALALAAEAASPKPRRGCNDSPGSSKFLVAFSGTSESGAALHRTALPMLDNTSVHNAHRGNRPPADGRTGEGLIQTGKPGGALGPLRQDSPRCSSHALSHAHAMIKGGPAACSYFFFWE